MKKNFNESATKLLSVMAALEQKGIFQKIAGYILLMV
jgi:hypothetical protein